MFDNGSFLRRRKRYKRTSLTHGVPFSAAVFSPFSPFWVRKPVPVLPVQFGAFPGFQENFDVFASGSNCFVNRAGRNITEQKIANGTYRDDIIKPEVVYDSRAKIEFIKRNMDAFRRNFNSMDLIARGSANADLSTNKNIDFDGISDSSSIVGKQSDIREHVVEQLQSNAGNCETNPLDFFYNDLDASNDKIDVENEAEDFCVSDTRLITEDCAKLKNTKPFLTICKSSLLHEKQQNELDKNTKNHLFASHVLLKTDSKLKNDDEEGQLSYAYMSPDHNTFSGRCSTSPTDFDNAEAVKQLWQINSISNKKCFESTVLDYDFVNKKRKYGNTKGFSIDNLIGRTVDET